MKYFMIVMVFSSLSLAQYNLNVNAAFRTDPRAKNLTATLAYDYLLRGEASKQTPFYSYARAGVVAGGSPSFGAFIQVAPIAPLIFEVQKSRTVRIDSSDHFDCQKFECQGVIDRTEYSVRAVAAYGHFFITPKFLWREVQSDSNFRPIYFEQEVATASPGFHRFQQASVILGYAISDAWQSGVIYSASEFSENRVVSHTASVFYRQKIGAYAATFGLSHYKYEQFDIQGPAGFLSLDYDLGDKLSLF